MIFLESKCFQLILTTTIGMTGGQSGSGSGMMESAFSSLFVPSQDVSTSAWEQYKTESLPSEDLSQCLARCMLHQRQWWNGLHSGWVSLKSHLMWGFHEFFRCNAITFESDLCEEAHIWSLVEADSGETPKDFLIRSEEARSPVILDHDCIALGLIFKNQYWTLILKLAFKKERRWMWKSCKGGESCCSRDFPCGQVWIQGCSSMNSQSKNSSGWQQVVFLFGIENWECQWRHSAEAQKPGWQGGIATRKVFARPESFCA